MRFPLYLIIALARASIATPVDSKAAPVDAKAGPADSVLTGKFASVKKYDWTIYQNLWGTNGAVGDQSLTIKSVTPKTVSFSTKWSFKGNKYQVKSYNNVAREVGKQISDVGSINAVWDWSVTSKTTDVFDVSFDLWLSRGPDSQDVYEIMIWPGSFGGAGPISKSNKAIATGLKLGGNTYSLWSGNNGQVYVYSFVADQTVNNFKADLMLFISHLVKNYKVDPKLYIHKVQAGTEPFEGDSVELTTKSYSLDITSQGQAQSPSPNPQPAPQPGTQPGQQPKTQPKEHKLKKGHKTKGGNNGPPPSSGPSCPASSQPSQRCQR